MAIELRAAYRPDPHPRIIHVGERIMECVSFKDPRGIIRFAETVEVKPDDEIHSVIKEILIVPGQPNKLLSQAEITLKGPEINETRGFALLEGNGKRLVWTPNR